MADIDRGPLVPLVAECYRRAALDGADMLRVVRAVEEVRAAAGDGQDLELAADVVVRAIATSQDKSIYPTLDELRTRIHHRLYETASAQLRERFRRGVQEGWHAWQSAWVHGIWNWPEPVWQWLQAAEYPFPETAHSELAELRAAGHAMLDDRWGDVYDPLERLAAAPWLPAAERASLVETLAMIQLYILLQPTSARTLLERAQELDAARHRVCAGWAQWWVKQATADADARASLDHARADARRAIALEPHFGRAWLVLGMVREKDDDPGQEEEQPEFYYRRALAEGEFAGWAELLRLELDRAEGSQADSGVQALLDLGRRTWPHKEPDVLLQLAEFLWRRRQLDEADDCYRRAIALDPSRVSAYTGRGYERFEANDVPTARAMFAATIELAPESVHARYGMAWLCEQLGEWGQALLHYERALELRPEWEATLTTRIGECLRRLDRLADAERELLAGLRRHPDDSGLASGLKDLAQHLYQECDDVNAAWRIYDELRAIRGQAYEGTYRNLRGNTYYWLADYVAAEVEYRHAAAAEPANAVFQSNIADALEARIKAGDHTQLSAAVQALRQATELDPEHAEYRERLSSLERRRGMLAGYGPAALERLPIATPVRVELADEFLPHILVPDTYDLQPVFREKIDAMRARVQDETGVWLPGIRFATFDGWVQGNARCSLLDASMRIEYLPIDDRFCPAPLGEVRLHAPKARAAGNPAGGPDGTLVPAASCASVAQAGLPLWETTDYLLGWVESIVRRHLVEFVGHDEIARRLTELTDRHLPEVELTAVTAAVRARLRRQETVRDLADICRQLVASPVPE